MNTNLNTIVKRGDIYLVDLGKENKVGSEQTGIRPVIIVQNEIGNRFSPTVIVATITSQTQKKRMPTQVLIGKESGLLTNSMAMMEQLLVISKERLGKYIGTAPNNIMEEIDKALKVSLELEKIERKEIQEAKRKAKLIEDMDNVIKSWLDMGRDVSEIYDFISERQARINDLKRYCENFQLAYTDYYAVSMDMKKEQQIKIAV